MYTFSFLKSSTVSKKYNVIALFDIKHNTTNKLAVKSQGQHMVIIWTNMVEIEY